jgi:hypothetical protein
MDDLSRIRRYELKYTISEALATEIRDYLKNICQLDTHVLPGESGYVVNNLYFDTSDLKFYNDTKFRKLTRYKPRARYYGIKIGDYIWPEIKYRHSNIIWKLRYKLPVSEWLNLFKFSDLKPKERKIGKRLERFEDLIFWYNAQSVLHVRYFREPYVTTLEEYGRITFDRNLCYRPCAGSVELDYNEQDMQYFDDPITTQNFESPVLLEIKVETLLPQWVISMIRQFHLVQRPFSKYCYGVDSFLTFITPPRNPISRLSKIK